MGSLKVVARNIDGDGLDISRDRFRVLGREVTQETTPVGAEFEIGFLNQVVDDLLREGTPLTGGSDDGKTDRAVETGDKFMPGCAVMRLRAGADQLLCRHRRIHGQRYPAFQMSRLCTTCRDYLKSRCQVQSVPEVLLLEKNWREPGKAKRSYQSIIVSR
jgi:hypothetical protein